MNSIKTVIYLDVLLLVNFLVAYFLLMASARLAAVQARFGRMMAASLIAACSALILLAPELPFPLQLTYKIATAMLIVAVAFGRIPVRRFCKAVGIYAVLNLVVAGAALLLILQTGTMQVHLANLTVYLRVSPITLLVLSAFCYAGVQFGTILLGHKQTEQASVGLELELCGVPVHLRAVLDTGCHLKDPVTCLPVLLVSYPDAKARLPAALCGFLEDWFHGERGSPLPPGMQLRLIPCTTASEQGLLPGISVKEIRLITGQGVLGLGRSAVAFAPRSFGSETHEALYGNDFL